MKVLLLGSGAREHALAWKLAQSPLLDRLFAAPGNPGIAAHAELVEVDAADHGAVAAFCAEQRVGLVVIGPEQPLVDGLADSLRAARVKVFGPSAAAAQLEGSKGFTKELCMREGIPTAQYWRASSISDVVLEILRGGPRYVASAADRVDRERLERILGSTLVVKADGLAAGKGVLVTHDFQEAGSFAAALVEAGVEVIFEEFMEGEEVSFFALTDGETVVPFGSAQDHKRVGDGDLGPNTGGMGAYSPASIFTAELERRVLAEILEPTVRAMAEAGTPFSGVLYAGLMLTAEGPKLVEYNARFGDPECQVLMARLESDLLELMLACAEGRLAEAPEPRFRGEAALTVVMAARGYPGTPEKGGEIRGVDGAGGEALVLHAGTAERDGTLVASGGRVLSVTALGRDVGEAQARAYAAVDRIDFPSGFCRRDIGWREIARLAR